MSEEEKLIATAGNHPSPDTTWRARAAAALLLMPLWLAAPAAGADGVPNGHTIGATGCYDQANQVQVPIERARAEVPPGYALRANETAGVPGADGQAGATVLLEVSELSCRSVSVGETAAAGPARIAFIGLELMPNAADHDPRATGNTPDDPSDDALLQDFYLLYLATDSKPLADWWRAGTGLQVHHTPLFYDYPNVTAPFGIAGFHFKAPGHPDWAFSVDGTAAAQNEDPSVFVDVNFWQDTKTPDGKTWKVKLGFPYHKNHIAPADVEITATAPDSRLAKLLARNPAKPTLAVGAIQDPWTGTKEVITRK